MLQIVYVSSAAIGTGIDPVEILATAQRNNEREGVTGALYFDGVRFMQALEGPEAAVEATFARIRADKRHRAVVVLARRTIEQRDFGDWAMASRRTAEDAAEFIARVERLVVGAAPGVRATFKSFAALRNAA